MATRGSGARTKGALGEREVSAILTTLLGVEIKRKLGASRDGGDDLATDDFSFEVKRQERLRITEWMEQAVENSSSTGAMPVLVFRQSRQPWRVVLDLTEFCMLAKAWLAAKEHDDDIGGKY